MFVVDSGCSTSPFPLGNTVRYLFLTEGDTLKTGAIRHGVH